MVNFDSIGLPFTSSTFSRVSTALARNSILGNLSRNENALLQVQQQLSTGLKILKPSDDTVIANRILGFNQRISEDDQFIRNIDGAKSRLEVSDNAVSNVNDIINRAREILLDQVGSTATAATRLTAAGEVGQLLQQAVNAANTKFEGRFIFGGSRTTQPPLVFVGGSVAFAGDTKSFKADVADGLQLPSNVSADNAFGVFSAELRGLNPATLLPINLNPAVTPTTKLSALNSGKGVTPGSIQIAGTGTATIDLSIAENVGTVLNLINAQTGVTGVTAAINPAGTGINLTMGPPGTITVSEVGGGRTATDLGVVTPPAGNPNPPGVLGTPLNPAVTPDTTVGSLLGGAGLNPSGIVITNQSSSGTFTATLGPPLFAPGSTIGQVLTAINNSNTFVDARINPQGTGIDVLSRLSGARLTISENGGTTASQLGLLSTLSRASLTDLNSGKGIGSTGSTDLQITKKDGTQAFFNTSASPNVSSLVQAINSTPGLTATLVGSSIQVTDTTGGAGPLTIANFGGSFVATNLGIALSTAGATITGTPLTFAGVQVEGVFTAIQRLRDALTSNDTVGINAAARLLDISQNKALNTRADAGSRVNQMDLTQNRLKDEKNQLEQLRSSDRDVDMADAATRFQNQQTVLQASLQVAARILQTNLLNFI